MKKPLREHLLNLVGLYWWPPNHNDPRINGPQPRLITRAQYEALKKLQENEDEDEDEERGKSGE